MTNQICPDFDWQLLKVESERDLAEALAKAPDGQLFVPGEPRPLSFSENGERRGRRITFVDLSPLKHIVEYEPADQVISVQAGISLAELDSILIENNQWFPVRFSRNRLLHEAIAEGDGGYLEHGYGGPRDLVLGLKVMLSDGEVINTGGKVVKNVSGYDLTKLFVGGRNSLGVPLSANLRLFARPDSAISLAAIADEPSTLIDLSSSLTRSGLPITALELVCLDLLVSKRAQFKIMRSELRERLQSIKGAARDGNSLASVLLVQVAGNSRVVSQVAPLVRAECERQTKMVLEESHIPEDPTVTQLFDPEFETKFVELCLSMSQMRDVFKRLEELGQEFPFTARPATGRFRLSGKGLEKFCDELNMTSGLRASGADDAGAPLAMIEERLKQKFDPGRRFAAIER